MKVIEQLRLRKFYFTV